jgi:Zn-dependent M28 family amino/carboxypeptidase
LDGYYSLDSTDNSTINHLLVEGAAINQLSISNVSISRLNRGGENNTVLLKTQHNSNVNYLQFSRINTEGIASLLSSTTGNLNVINASNIIYTGSSGHYPFYLNNDLNVIKALTISNFFGSDLIFGGKSRILKKSGDAF